MEEQQKFVEAISEETLDEVAGGLKLDKGTMKKALVAAGVTILSVAAAAGGGTLVAGKFGKGPAAGLFSGSKAEEPNVEEVKKSGDEEL